MSDWINVRQALPDVLKVLEGPAQGPRYAPPYDSPIEDRFAWHAVKYLEPAVEWTPQFEVSTVCGRFRIDFVAHLHGRTVGFECDGAQYHDDGRDRFRDALILFDAGTVDAIYRLRGTDIHWRIHDLLYLLARHEPTLFSERSVSQLTRLANTEVLQREVQADCDGVLLVYPLEPEAPRTNTESLHLRHRTREGDPRTLRFERVFVAFAQTLCATPLDEAITEWYEHLMATPSLN